MPDRLPPGLPPALPTPGGAPPPDRFRRALDRSRQRRRQRALGLGGSSGLLMAVAALLLVLPSGGGQQRLLVDREGAAVAGSDATEPAAATTPGAGDPSAEPSAGSAPGGPGPETSPDPETSPGAVEPPAEQEPSPDPDPAQEPGQEPEESEPGAEAAPEEVGPPSRRVAYDPSLTCDGSGPTAAQGWCSSYTGARKARVGESVVLSTQVCRMPGRGTGELFTDDGQHAKFVVGGRWRWSHGRRFAPTATTITVPAGECVRWEVAWDLRNNSGQPLAAGSYDLEALPRVGTGPNSAYVDNTETFTISS